MALAHSPRIVTDGLVLYLDAANQKRYDDSTENLVTYSEQFDTSAWAKSGTVTANAAVSPDGNMSAELVSGGRIERYDIAYNASTTYTFSCFFKGTSGQIVGLGWFQGPQVGDIQLQYFTLDGTWQRFSTTYTITTGGIGGRVIISGNGDKLATATNFYVWGAQLETGSSVTTYYVTTTITKSKGTIWTDLSGFGNNSTLINGPTYSTANGGNIVFNGITQYSTESVVNSIISNPALNGYLISFSLWVNVTSGNYILSSGGQTNSSGIAFSYNDDSIIPFYIIKGVDKTATGYFNKSDFPSNTWANWTITSDGTTVKLYKNGTILSSTTYTTGGSSPTYTNLTIGRPNNFMAWLAAMKFSWLVFYNRALSATEVSQNFNAMRGRYGI